MKEREKPTTHWSPSAPPGLLATAWNSSTRKKRWSSPTRIDDPELHNEVMSAIQMNMDWNRRLLKWLKYTLSLSEVATSDSTDSSVRDKSSVLSTGVFHLTKDVIEPLRLIPASGFSRDQGLCEALWKLGNHRFIVHLHSDRTYDWLHRENRTRLGSGESIPFERLYELRKRIGLLRTG